jgi:hypothetical protein
MNIFLISYLILIFKKLNMLGWSHLSCWVQLFINFISCRLILSRSLKLLNIYLLKIRFLLLVNLLFHYLYLILNSLRIKNWLWSLRPEYSIHCPFPLFLRAQYLVFWLYQFGVLNIRFHFLIVLISIQILILVNFMASTRSCPPF